MLFEAIQVVLLPLLAEALNGEYQKTATSNTTPAPKKTLSEEEQVRQAAASCLQYWSSSSKRKDRLTKAPKEIHEKCLVTSLVGDKSLTTSLPGESFSFSNEEELKPADPAYKISWIKILPVSSQSAAVARVTTSPNNTEGFLSLLKSPQFGWICIHAAFSSASSGTAIQPWDYKEVQQLVWDRYRQANRLCDGALMAHAIHKSCRLTFIKNEDIEIIAQTEFCRLVQNRYSEAVHQPFVACQTHPDVERYDTLQSIEFATPNLCLVTLRVAHPPCVWTDSLVCCNLGREGWWIVHKSDCQEDFELTDDMKRFLQGEEGSFVN